MHHLRQGVEHFFLVDNGSEDAWTEELHGLPCNVVVDPTRPAMQRGR